MTEPTADPAPRDAPPDAARDASKTRLSSLTTLRVGGPAGQFVVAENTGPTVRRR